MNTEKKVIAIPAFLCVGIRLGLLAESDENYRHRLLQRYRKFINATLPGERIVQEATDFWDNIKVYSSGELNIHGETSLEGIKALPRLTTEYKFSPEVLEAYIRQDSGNPGSGNYIFGGKIAAIKVLREETFLGLKEAKDLVEWVAQRDNLLTFKEKVEKKVAELDALTFPKEEENPKEVIMSLIPRLSFDGLSELIKECLKIQSNRYWGK